MAQFGTIADWLNYDKIRMASAKRNLVGEGIGEAFTGIAQIIEEKVDGKKKKDAKKQEEIKTNLLDRLKKAVPPPTNLDPNPTQLETDVSLTLQAEKERPNNDPKKIIDTPPPVNTPAAELSKTDPLDFSISTSYNTPSDRTFDLYDYSNQNYNSQLTIGDSIKNKSATTKDLARMAQNQMMSFLLPSDSTYGPSPFPRRKRSVGVQSGAIVETAEREQKDYQSRRYNPEQDPYLDEQGRAEMISTPGFLGGSAGAFAEGYNLRIKRRSYARKSFDKAQKGLEDVFSQLQVESSSVDSIDAATDIMGQQAKKAFLELEKNKYNMEPGEYTAAKQSILSQPKLIGQSMAVLKKRIDDFTENRHLLSKGNNPETLDLLDSLSKNEGTIQPVMRDGKAYLVGKTGSGSDIDIPLSEIANGRNDFKFLTRFDPNETLTNMVNKYGKLKKDAEFRTATGAGIESKTLPIDVFEKDVKSDINKMLADDNILRSVVADYLDADFDTFEEIKAAGLDPKNLAANELYNQFKTKFDPLKEQTSIKTYKSIDPNVEKFKREEEKLKLEKLKSEIGSKGGSNSKDGLDSLSQTFSDPNFYASFESAEGITPDVIKATIGANALIDEENPDFIVVQDPGAPNQEIRIPRKGPQARQKAVDILARQVFKVKDISKIKLTPTVSQGGPQMPYTLPKK